MRANKQVTQTIKNIVCSLLLKAIFQPYKLFQQTAFLVQASSANLESTGIKPLALIG